MIAARATGITKIAILLLRSTVDGDSLYEHLPRRNAKFLNAKVESERYNLAGSSTFDNWARFTFWRYPVL